MQISISVDPKNQDEVKHAQAILGYAAQDNTKASGAGDEKEERSEISIADIKKKRGRKSKAEKEAEETAEEESEETESEESEEDANPDDESESAEETEEEFSEEDEVEEAEEGLSESELTKLKGALKAYSAKHDKKKAIGILKKFAERSDLVKAADLPKLMKLLKV